MGSSFVVSAPQAGLHSSSLAHEEDGLHSSPQSLQIVELAALLHDIGDYKYVRDHSEEAIVERFLEEDRIEESER
ncbi:hypothetical protein ACHQM5_011967 [Ranunculus cassubicifolius]